MTAIITKQNALDKACINGSGGGDGEFNNIHVKGTATFDGEAIFKRSNEHGLVYKYTIDEVKNTVENHEERIKTNAANIATNTSSIANHEERITANTTNI